MRKGGVSMTGFPLIIAFVIAIILMIVAISKFKIHPFISIMTVSLLLGLVAGIPLVNQTADDGTVTLGLANVIGQGFSGTFTSIGIVIILGALIGTILEKTGAALKLADMVIHIVGKNHPELAMELMGWVVSIPVFCDSGFVILNPIRKALVNRTGASSVAMTIGLSSGLYIAHVFIPPTPGPVLVATMLNVELGWVILVGVCCGFFAMIVAGPVWGAVCGKKFYVPVPDQIANQEDIDESKLPSFASVVTIIMIPLALIILKSVAGVVPALAGVAPLFNFLGQPFAALLIATLAAMFILGTRHGYTMPELEKILTKSLEPTGLILLVTACGGVLRYILQYSGLGEIIGNAVASINLPIVIVAFLVAALVRICVGSATVAMTMAAGIVAAMPEIASLSPMYLACVVAAVAGGATVCSHFNDSGFWLVRSLIGLDEKTTLKTWTIMETLVGGTGFIVALIISFFV